MFYINKRIKRAFISINLLNGRFCFGRDTTCSQYNECLMDELKMVRFESSEVINSDTGTGTPYPTNYTMFDMKLWGR